MQILLTGFGFFLITGCQEYNPYQPVAEAESLSHITQITAGFDRAGEASVSRDQRWIVFRAMKAPDTTLQLYVARLNWQDTLLTGIERPIPITPAGTRNFSGCFSPDGSSLIFSSTALGLDPKPTTARFPIDMRIFRFDDWEGAVSMTDSVTGVDLAKHPLTTDRAYTGECSYSPNGKWICFTSTRDGNPDLYVMHADGSHIVRLTKTIGYDGGHRSRPMASIWSITAFAIPTISRRFSPRIFRSIPMEKSPASLPSINSRRMKTSAPTRPGIRMVYTSFTPPAGMAAIITNCIS